MTIAARRAAVAVACWSAASLLIFLVNYLDVGSKDQMRMSLKS